MKLTFCIYVLFHEIVSCILYLCKDFTLLTKALELLCLNAMRFLILVHPNPPIMIDPVTISSTSVQVSWMSGFDGNSDIQKYTLHIKPNFSQNWTVIDNSIEATEKTYIVTNLKPYVVYYFRLQAENEIGYSEYSEISMMRTLATGLLFECFVLVIVWTKVQLTNGKYKNIQIVRVHRTRTNLVFYTQRVN